LGQALAKAEAARQVAQLNRGVYWIGTDHNLILRRHYNWLYLHARRQSFATYDEISATLLAHWSWGEVSSVNEFVKQFGSRWSDQEVEATVWKLVAEAAASGRLLVDLTKVELTCSTELALLDPSLPPILPDPLPQALEPTEEERLKPLFEIQDRSDQAILAQEIIPDATFDASTLSDPEQRARFYRNLAAVTARLEGVPRRQVAQRYQMHAFTLARLEQRVQQFGQMACVPHATYHRDRQLHPAFEALLRKLYTHPIRPTIMAVYEDVRVQQLAEQLSEQEKRLVKTPSYKQVRSFLKGIEQEREVHNARSGLKHSPRERLSSSSFVLSIPYPASLCQVDEHTLDLLVTTNDGIVLTRRVHAAVLICVKTAAILAAVLALDALREEEGLHALSQDGTGAQRPTYPALRVPTPVALLRQTDGDLSRPRQNFHLRTSYPSPGGSAWDHDRASPCLRAFSERNHRGFIYLDDEETGTSPSRYHQGDSTRSWSL